MVGKRAHSTLIFLLVIYASFLLFIQCQLPLFYLYLVSFGPAKGCAALAVEAHLSEAGAEQGPLAQRDVDAKDHDLHEAERVSLSDRKRRISRKKQKV